MKCSNCGKNVPDGKLFCGYCGTSLKIELQPKKKPSVKTKQGTKKTKVPGTAKVKSPQDKNPSVRKKTVSVEKKKVNPLVWILPILVIGALLIVLLTKPSSKTSPAAPAQEQGISNEQEQASESMQSETLDEYPPPLEEAIYCRGDDIHILPEQPFQLRMTWFTATEDQATEFLDISTFTANIEGDPLYFFHNDGPFPYTLDDGTEGFISTFVTEDLILDKGTYTVEGQMILSEKHFDGWDWFGPGGDYETSDFSCVINIDDKASTSTNSSYPSEIDSFVKDAKNVFHFPCDRLDSSYLYWDNNVYVEDESIIVDGLATNQEGAIGTIPFGTYGKALLYKIKIIPDPEQTGWNIFGIDAGQDAEYQGVFIGISDTNEFANFTHFLGQEGSEYSQALEIGNIDPNQWYYALFATFDDGDVYLRIWPQGEPENYADAEQQMQVPSAQNSWSLIIHAFERGKFILDDYWILDFSEIY